MMGSGAAPTTSALGVAAITVRPLGKADEYAACVLLQRETWGAGFTDFVPGSLLKVSQMVGGVSCGAFTAEGELVGFVYGLSGVREGRLIHWSHMLAVRPEYRGQGLGRRLKEYQREVLRGLGVEMAYWTFDPLIARNAHLNLNRLGTEVREYVPDMYGDTGSELHAFGTDRFLVSWPVAAESVRSEPGVPAAWRTAPVFGHGVREGEDGVGAGTERPADGSCHGALLVRIEVPPDVETMPVAQACAWRAATRPAFIRLMSGGYRVLGFFTLARGRCFYVLGRTAAEI
jgi:predicted GNAT superfamily acetyltransferase